MEAVSYVVSDSPRLGLEVSRTDYFTLRSVLPLVRGDASVRAEFGSLSPETNRIPHSLCLHYIVRLFDGKVLCMRRDKRAAYHASRWSFTGEEQLSDLDFTSVHAMQALFRRSFCEEVLALRDETPLDERWEIAEKLVQSTALWSLFVEEGIQNWSLLGFYQLRCDAAELVAEHNRLVDRGIGTRDLEGAFYVVPHEALTELLVKGSCTATGLFSGEDVTVAAEDFHPTSRYRIFRLLRAVNRGSLQYS